MHAYWLALLGGALIGLAAVLLMASQGRIAGVSGIVGGLLRPRSGSYAWRVSFVLGLLSAPLLLTWLRGDSGVGAPVVSLPVMLLAGLLVGIGTGLGSGCTSGHGVCGIARWSPRSLVATLTFVALGIVTVYLLRHVLGVSA
jgi:uncharacterized membrane protein YedE/YeeE